MLSYAVSTLLPYSSVTLCTFPNSDSCPGSCFCLCNSVVRACMVCWFMQCLVMLVNICSSVNVPRAAPKLEYNILDTSVPRHSRRSVAPSWSSPSLSLNCLNVKMTGQVAYWFLRFDDLLSVYICTFFLSFALFLPYALANITEFIKGRNLPSTCKKTQ